MIIIDGRQSDMHVNNFSNLEEILIKVMEAESMENRIVTDVLVNDEAFSEIYPHQAEDIESADIRRVEVRSVSMREMAADVATELYKVITLMTSGARRVAVLLRQADTLEGLEVLQDVIDVTRNFLGTVGLLRQQFSAAQDREIAPLTSALDANLQEMLDVMDNEDWILLADLVEYEFLPLCRDWNEVIANLETDISSVKAA